MYWKHCSCSVIQSEMPGLFGVPLLVIRLLVVVAICILKAIKIIFRCQCSDGNEHDNQQRKGNDRPQDLIVLLMLAWGHFDSN